MRAVSRSGLAWLCRFPGFARLGADSFREDAGLMLRGLPEATGVTAGAPSGSDDLKYTRQPGVSCDLFLIMQAVTRSTSGMSAPQRRNASPLHACSSSWV